MSSRTRGWKFTESAAVDVIQGRDKRQGNSGGHRGETFRNPQSRAKGGADRGTGGERGHARKGQARVKNDILENEGIIDGSWEKY